MDNIKNERTKTADYKDQDSRKKIHINVIAIVCICSFLVCILCVIFTFPKVATQRRNNIKTITKSSLEKVIEINDLSTLDYTYNAIACVKDEMDNVKYYVAYESVVTAGIDINQVGISVDEQSKAIEIRIPEATIQNINIDMGTLDFIFIDDKYETETVSQEAYKACLAEMEERAKKEDSLLVMAKNNAVDAITALIMPWVEQIDEEYTIDIK